VSLIKWNDGLSVGIANIDEQHKKFVDIINKLFDARREKTSPEVMGKLIDELTDYARVHFKTEELYFEMYDYPEAKEHKEEHDQLVSKVQEFKEKFDDGSDLFVAGNLATFLNTWLSDHLIKIDKKYSRFLHEQGLV